MPAASFRSGVVIDPVSKLRTRSEIFFLVKNGLTQKKPDSRTEPLYSPNSSSTRESLGAIAMKPNREMMPARSSRTPVTTAQPEPSFQRIACSDRTVYQGPPTISAMLNSRGIQPEKGR